MKHFFAALCVIFLSVTGLYAQRASSDLFISNSAPESNMKQKFDAQVKDAVFLKINKNELNRLYTERNDALRLTIPVTLRGVSSNAVLELVKFDIVTPQTRFVIKTANGEEDIKAHNLIVSYTGKVKGMENSFVTLTFTQDKVIAIVMSDRETYTLGTTDENNKNEDNYILFQEGLRKVHRDFKCGSETMETPERIKKMM